MTDRLDAALRRDRLAAGKAKDAREHLEDVIAELVRNGEVQQKDVAARTGRTRETIRQMCERADKRAKTKEGAR